MIDDAGPYRHHSTVRSVVSRTLDERDVGSSNDAPEVESTDLAFSMNMVGVGVELKSRDTHVDMLYMAFAGTRKLN